jgi:proteic killer suppression protein
LHFALDNRNRQGYNIYIKERDVMIKGFRSKELEKFFFTGKGKIPQPKHSNRAEMILDLLDAAVDIGDMNFPGSGLHKLEPKKEERWAVKISGNWRITFIFKDGEVFEVDYIDYH